MKNAQSRSPEEAQRIPGAPVRVHGVMERSGYATNPGFHFVTSGLPFTVRFSDGQLPP